MALLLQCLVDVLRHPLVQAVQVQATLVLLIGILGWTIAGNRKGREAKRLTAAGYAAALQQIQATLESAALASTAGAVEVHQQSPSSSVDGSAVIHESGDAATSGKPAIPAAVITALDHPQLQTEILRHWRQKTGQLSPNPHHQQHQEQVPACTGLIHRQTVSQQHEQQPSSYPAAKGTYSMADVRHSSIFRSQMAHTVGLQPGWPSLAVVCPVKGCRQHSRENWATQLSAHYGGPRVFVFVVESELDPAVAALEDIMQQHQQCSRQRQTIPDCKQQPHDSTDGQRAGFMHHHQQQQHQQCGKQQQTPLDSNQQLRNWTAGQYAASIHQQQLLHQQQHHVLHRWQDGPHQQVVLVNAGLATTCSQKIHNILAGIDVALQQQQQQQGAANSSSGGYVCILDDDVALHPLSLMQLVDDLEADQSLFMVTGYPYDIVTAPNTSNSNFWGRLCSYAAAAYHLPLSIGFSVADRGGFVWGGVMVLRANYLAAAAAELAAADGAKAAGLVVGAQAAAAGSQKAASGCSSMSRDVDKPMSGVSGTESRNNLLQVWRDGGYSDDLLLSGFCAAHNLSIGLPVSATFPQLLPATCTFKQYWNYLRRQLFVLDTYYSAHNRQLNHTMMILHSYGSALFTGATAATAVQLLMLTLAVITALFSGSVSSSRGIWSGVDLSLHFHSVLTRTTTAATWLFAASTLGSWIAIWYVDREVGNLFRVLSPNACREVLDCRVSVLMLWLGWTLENAILPICTLYCYMCDHIMWGGITYHKKNGRVDRIIHPKA